MGVRLAIDDFGTGYSSLSYLHRFPVDMLKIDRSFVDHLRGASEDTELVRTIVRLGQSLRMMTVGEGVEDHAQFLTLKRIGCDVAQGFYFSKPVAAELIDDMLGETERYSAPPSNVTALSSARKRSSARPGGTRAGRRGRCARSPAPRLNASTLASCRSPGGGPPKAPPVRPLNLYRARCDPQIPDGRGGMRWASSSLPTIPG